MSPGSKSGRLPKGPWSLPRYEVHNDLVLPWTLGPVESARRTSGAQVSLPPTGSLGFFAYRPPRGAAARTVGTVGRILASRPSDGGGTRYLVEGLDRGRTGKARGRNFQVQPWPADEGKFEEVDPLDWEACRAGLSLAVKKGFLPEEILYWSDLCGRPRPWCHMVANQLDLRPQWKQSLLEASTPADALSWTRKRLSQVRGPRSPRRAWSRRPALLGRLAVPWKRPAA